MGKAGRAEADAEQAFPNSAPATRSWRCRCGGGAVVGKVVNRKCISVLFLAVSGFLSALFLLLHFRASGDIPDYPGVLAEIQAGFILPVSHSQVASQAEMLEKEIYTQIGVPNSTVSVSVQPYKYDTTYVRFGVLPDPRNTSMSAESINTLKTSLIKLTLQQLNLSLTPSVFGDPFCLEILGFPGGITVWFPHVFPAYSIQPLFNITFNSTIHEMMGILEEMKIELGSTLELTSDEELCLELTNTNGSTIATPVTVQVSLSPVDHIIDLLPDRLKQLAQIITEWSARNLGLNTSIFGRIMDFKLAPPLQAFVPSCAPSLSPTSTSSLSWPPISEHPNTYPSVEVSCPALVTIQNETTKHRRLMRVSSKIIHPQLSTQFHRKYTSDGKKNGIAVAARTFTAPAPRPK